MKKIFAVIFAFTVLMFVNVSTSYARQIRFVDVGVENFTNQLKQVLVADRTQQYFKSFNCANVSITDVTRRRNFDVINRGLSAWSCDFSMSGTRQGQLMFLSDMDGYIFEICVACYNSKSSALAGAAIMWCINTMSMDLTQSESDLLGKTWNTWSVNKNRRFVISRETNEDGIFMIYKAYDS